MILHNLCQGLDSIVWAACFSLNPKYNGLLEFSPEHEQHKFYPIPYDSLTYKYEEEGRPYNTIHDLEVDNSGKLIIATLGYGLHVFDPKTEILLSHNKSFHETLGIQANFIVDLFKSHLGKILLTGRDHEIPVVSGKDMGPRFFARFNPDDQSSNLIELPSFYQYANPSAYEEIFQDHSGNTWI